MRLTCTDRTCKSSTSDGVTARLLCDFTILAGIAGKIAYPVSQQTKLLSTSVKKTAVLGERYYFTFALWHGPSVLCLSVVCLSVVCNVGALYAQEYLGMAIFRTV